MLENEAGKRYMYKPTTIVCYKGPAHVLLILYIPSILACRPSSSSSHPSVQGGGQWDSANEKKTAK